MPFSRASDRSRDRAWLSCIADRFFTAEPPGALVQREKKEKKRKIVPSQYEYLTIKYEDLLPLLFQFIISRDANSAEQRVLCTPTPPSAVFAPFGLGAADRTRSDHSSGLIALFLPPWSQSGTSLTVESLLCVCVCVTTSSIFVFSGLPSQEEG